MGIIMLLNWPMGASWIIGLLIGVSFLFDGIALYAVANKMEPVATQ